MNRIAQSIWRIRWGIAALFVLAILGLAVVVGRQRSAHHSAETCKANMSLARAELVGYAQSHGGRLPTAVGQEWPLQYEGYVQSLAVLYCQNDKTAMRDYGNATGESLTYPATYSLKQVLLLLRKRYQTITNYELPAAIGEAVLDKLPAKTVLLEEHGPGHNGKHWVLYVDGTFAWRDGILEHTPFLPPR